jgi:hypothetical protein
LTAALRFFIVRRNMADKLKIRTDHTTVKTYPHDLGFRSNFMITLHYNDMLPTIMPHTLHHPTSTVRQLPSFSAPVFA